jgi:hypothetical protein
MAHLGELIHLGSRAFFDEITDWNNPEDEDIDCRHGGGEGADGEERPADRVQASRGAKQSEEHSLDREHCGPVESNPSGALRQTRYRTTPMPKS